MTSTRSRVVLTLSINNSQQATLVNDVVSALARAKSDGTEVDCCFHSSAHPPVYTGYSYDEENLSLVAERQVILSADFEHAASAQRVLQDVRALLSRVPPGPINPHIVMHPVEKL
jgi:hypothetical protein